MAPPPHPAAFSKRTQWPRESNRWSAAVAEARGKRRSCIDLTDSNVTHFVAPPAPEALRAALEDPANLRYEPRAFGDLSAREAVVDYYRRRGLRTELDSVLLVASTSEAYGHLFRLLADPGGEILVPSPSYPLLEHLADLADVKLIAYPLHYDGTWHLAPGALEERTSERTSAIVLVSPNNPTGSILDPTERARVIALAGDLGLALISDEVFADYLDAPKRHADASLVGTQDALSFSLNGLSKCAGLPQIKAGWVVLSGPSADRREAQARLEIVLDAHLSISGPAQAVLTRLLPRVDDWQADLRLRLAQNRAELDRALLGSPARRRASAGGWSAIVELPNLQTDELWALELLEEHQILGQPGYLFDLLDRPCLVLSLLADPETFAEGVRRLARGVARGSS